MIFNASIPSHSIRRWTSKPLQTILWRRTFWVDREEEDDDNDEEEVEEEEAEEEVGEVGEEEISLNPLKKSRKLINHSDKLTLMYMLIMMVWLKDGFNERSKKMYFKKVYK